MLQQASTKTSLTAKKLTVTLGETRPGFEAHVLGVAVDSQNVYATHYYNPIGVPKESLEPGKLFVLNKNDLSSIAQIEVGHQPRKVALNPGQRRAYVTNYHQSSYSISIVDLNARAEISQIKLGQVPIDVAVNTRTNRIYVTNPFQRKVHVIDGKTNAEVMSVNIGPGATGITVDASSGLVYVACTFRSAEPHVSSVVVIDGSTDIHNIVATLQIDPDGAQPSDVSVFGNRVYVGGLGGGPVKPAIAIFERNGRAFTRLSDYPTQAGVVALDMFPQARLLFASVAGSLQAFKTDTDSEALLAKVGHSLQGLAVDHSTGHVYVGHAFDGAISRLVPLPHIPQFNLEEDLGLTDEPVQISEDVWFLGKGIHPSQVRHVTPHNTAAADTTNTERLQEGGDLSLNLNGSGLTVGVWEAPGDDEAWKIRDTHQELSGRVTIDPIDAQSDPDSGFSSHATHVAGTIGAAGVDRRARGMASQIKLLSYKSNDDIKEMARDAALIIASNHSYGLIKGWDIAVERSTENSGTVKNIDIWKNDYSISKTEDIGFGKYTSEARQLDVMLADKANQHLLSVWSAGNDRDDAFSNEHGDNTFVAYFSANPNIPGFPWTTEGWYQVSTNIIPPPNSDGNGGTGFDSIGGMQTAKNNLVVGAIQDITTDPYHSSDIKISDFSSWGPMDDGRIKPDVVANGVDLYSAVEKSDAAYALKQGTSMAAPNATGTAALLIQYYQNLFNTQPRSATIKGLLIHTAFDAIENPVAGGLPLIGPDYVYGWGLIDAAAAAIFLKQTHASNPAYFLDELDYKGTKITTSVLCEENQGPLKATLVWTDPAGNLPSNNVDDPTSALVNDLDLWITGPDGTIYHPWTLDPQNPMNPAKRDSANHVDNVEQVVVDTPVAGTYKIHISHTGSLKLSPQPYSLLVNQELMTRKILVDGKMFAKDDETVGGDEHGETDVRGEMSVSASVPSSDSIYQELRVGGEVRVELEISAELSTRNYVHITGSAKLFEGTSEDTQDLEDEEAIDLHIAPDAAIKHNIHLRNSGVGGGDTADIELELKNIPVLKDVVDRVCPNRLPLNVGDLKIPYSSNKSLEQLDTTVRQAVIVLHGHGRNGTGYYEYVLDAATKAGKLNETLIIAPHFLIEVDVDQRNPGNDVPFWTIGGWKKGDSSLSTAKNPRSAQISSFEVVDIIVAKLSDQNIFPNLQTRLTFVGHSAGGQFVNRYAAARQEGLSTKYVVANPSSYLYMDQQRRVAGTLDQFAIPDALTQDSCPTFNQYHYGLEDLNPYMQAVGADQISSQYAQRQVIYLLGEADNDPTPDEGDVLDQSCAANLQGSQRLERGTIYFNYINHFYGVPVIQGRHTIVTVPGVGHSANGMFNSPQGITAIFG